MTTAGRTGLGIDLCHPQTSSTRSSGEVGSYSTVRSAPGAGASHFHDDVMAVCDLEALSGTLVSQGNIPAMKSISAMRGLTLAEIGDSMVELDICGGGSGFREGQRIALASLTPGGGSKPHTQDRPVLRVEEASLTRQGTLLTVGAPPGRNAAELKSLLGNSNARLKSGASLVPPPGRQATDVECVTLEQAKPKAQVEVDIVLESNICVQGSYLKGHVKIVVHKPQREESAVLLAGGKVRVVGFECIQNENDRHTFYQHSAPLSAITDSLHSLYGSLPDSDGCAEAREGVHVLPFAMLLPLEGESGSAVGVLQAHSGVTVRYIALVSIKVKDRVTEKRSIAHFYRNCEIWPRLNPSVVLASLSKPLQATTSKSLFMGGNGKVTLTATLHRLHWIAGQKCFVKVTVVNYTKKTIKSLVLSVVRTTTCFKPHPHLDALPYDREHAADPDACQTSTTQKQVSESILEMGQRSTKRHVSAKGWWTGVNPGEDTTFSHFILLPPDALSVVRVRLLEVDYAIRVSLNAGSLASEVHVTLPIKIINFVSLDPPPSSPLSLPVASINHNDVYKNTFELTEAYNGVRNHHRSRPVINGVFASDDGNPRILDPLLESDEISGPLESEDHSSLRDYSPDSVGSVEDYYADGDQSSSSPRRYSHCVGGTSLSDDESDDVVDHAIISSRKDAGYNDSPARFSDLYYCSVQEVPESSVSISDVSEAELLTQKEYEETNVDNTPRPPAQDLPMTNLIASDNPVPTAAVSVTYLSRPSRPRGPSSFALRVQEKLQVAIGEMEASHLAPLNTALGSDSSNFDQLLKTVAALGPGSEHCVLSDPDPGYSSSPSSSSTHERCSFELPSDEAGSINRVIESAAAHSRMDSAIRTSRLLPTLPSATSLDPSATISIPPTLHTDTPHVEPSSVRPRLQQPPGVISSSSVKDKIRELEERMKCSI